MNVIAFYNLFNHLHCFPFSKISKPFFLNNSFENFRKQNQQENFTYIKPLILNTEKQNDTNLYYSDFISPLSSFKDLLQHLNSKFNKKTVITFIPIESYDFSIKKFEIDEIESICSQAPVIGIYSNPTSNINFYDYVFSIGNDSFSIGKEILKYSSKTTNLSWNYIFTATIETIQESYNDYINDLSTKKTTFFTLTEIIRNSTNCIYFPSNHINCKIVKSLKFFDNKNGIIDDKGNYLYSNKKFNYITENISNNQLYILDDIIVNINGNLCSKKTIKEILKKNKSNLLY